MQSVTLRAISAAAAVLIIVLLGAETASAALAPYFEGFDDVPADGVPTNFVETPDSSWSGGGGFYQGSTGTNGNGVPGLASSTINLTNVVGHNFTVRARFTAVSGGNSDFRFADAGLVILADNPDATNRGYRLYWEAAGLGDVHNKLSLRCPTNQNVGDTSLGSLAPPRGEHEFIMTLRGVYVNGSLHLTGTLSVGPKKISAQVTDPAPLTGTYFGLWLNASVSSGHISSIFAKYDDFSVTLDP